MDGERRQGRVEFWDRGRGWGRVSLDGDARRTRIFVHARDVASASRLPKIADANNPYAKGNPYSTGSGRGGGGNAKKGPSSAPAGRSHPPMKHEASRERVGMVFK